MITPEIAHKSRPEFVLIKDTDKHDTFELVFDVETEDRLCDHQTGAHISGMVLLEAARQAAAVVLERGFPDLSESHAAVLDHVDIDFTGYAFAARKTALTVGYAANVFGSRVDAHVQVTVNQGDTKSASALFSIVLLPRAVLRRAERNALNRKIANENA